MAWKQKHDWIRYKQDYFDSDIDELTEFFASYKRTVGKHTFKGKTQGWKEEKLAYKKKLAENAREKLANDPDITDIKIQIKKSCDNVVKKVAKLIGNKEEFEISDMKNVKLGWEILKTELGEVTKITDNNIGFKEKPVFKQVKL